MTGPTDLPAAPDGRLRRLARRIPRGVSAGLGLTIVGAILVATSEMTLGTFGVGLMSIGLGVASASLNLTAMRSATKAARASETTPWWMMLVGPRLALGSVFGAFLILFGLVILVVAVALR